jgi:hypothetical protein
MSLSDVKELVERLFGVSWDRVLAGFVYSLASGWFWWAVLTPVRPRSPLDGVTHLLETLTITPPAWISGTASWLSHPERAGLVVVLAVGAALAATIYAGTQSTGSEAACVILTLAALQGGGWTLLMITLVTVAIPVALSWRLAVVQENARNSDDPPLEPPLEGLFGNHTTSVTVKAAFSSSFPFLLIPFAPLAVVVIVIRCLSADHPVDEAAALSYGALHWLHTGSAEDRQVAAQTLILAGALLADPHDKQARQAAARSLRGLLTGPTGAAPVQLRPRL